MVLREVTLTWEEVRGILATASADVAMLYLYLRFGNEWDRAEKQLKMSRAQFDEATATLRGLGLFPDDKFGFPRSDALDDLDQEALLQQACKEARRVLETPFGEVEMNIVRRIVFDYGIPIDVFSLLVFFLKEQFRKKSKRKPSLHAIEMKARDWAELGINTWESANDYIKIQSGLDLRVERIVRELSIRDRLITHEEREYLIKWFEMGFDDNAIIDAYHKTCLNKGCLNWNYMDGILSRCHKSGLYTGEEIRFRDRRPPSQSGRRELDEDELASIAALFREDIDGGKPRSQSGQRELDEDELAAIAALFKEG